jgi:hypothetical protein
MDKNSQVTGAICTALSGRDPLTEAQLLSICQGGSGTEAQKLWSKHQEAASADPLSLLFYSMLSLGSKSLSHMTSVLERNHVILKDLASRQGATAVLETLTRFWKNNGLFTLFVLKKLVAMDVLKPEEIVSYETQHLISDHSIVFSTLFWSTLDTFMAKDCENTLRNIDLGSNLSLETLTDGVDWLAIKTKN